MPPDLSDVDVLYLEHNANLRAMVRMVLSSLGIQRVRVTGNMKVAEEMFETAPPDIVIADWSSEIDSIAFLNKVRRDESSAARMTPFIVVSANTAMDDIITARDHGATEFLRKPFSAKELYERICSVVENPRPFVVDEAYVGPDRRRRSEDYKGKERRKSKPRIVARPSTKADKAAAEDDTSEGASTKVKTKTRSTSES